MSHDDERELLGQRLMEHCPVSSLSADGPWALKHEREREWWRMLADLALATQPVPPELTSTLALMDTLVAENQRLNRLRRYARHLDGCAKAELHDRTTGIALDMLMPCTCGLEELIGPAPPPGGEGEVSGSPS